MKKHLSNVIRSIVFLLILTASLFYINKAFQPKYILMNSKWPTTSSYNQFYDMKENSVDVLFLGSSVAVNGFSPQEIYNEYGIRSYNLSSEQQSMFLSYYWLKEALRFQDPKVVVLDTRFLFDIHPEYVINTSESLVRKCLDPMRWSPVKREAVHALCELDPQQSEMSYYLTNIRFHTRWSLLTEQDIVKSESQYSELKGFSPIETYGPKNFETYSSAGDTSTKMDVPQIMQTYFDKIVELCKVEGIRLVLVSLPGNKMNDAYNNTLTQYANEHDLDYYNMCETDTYNAIGAELPRECVVGHENLWGSVKMSQYVGNLLKNTYDVPSVEDAQYETTKDFYAHIIKNCELPHITDMNEYLRSIRDDHYTVLIASRNNASKTLTDEMKENLHALGLTEDLTDKALWSYAAVISPETGVQECSSEREPASVTGSMRDKKTFFSVTSCGYYAGQTSLLTIDDTNYCKNQIGLNFVIYDNELMKVVDVVAFDTMHKGKAVR